jgi:hypothetical protein
LDQKKRLKIRLYEVSQMLLRYMVREFFLSLDKIQWGAHNPREPKTVTAATSANDLAARFAWHFRSFEASFDLKIREQLPFLIKSEPPKSVSLSISA